MMFNLAAAQGEGIGQIVSALNQLAVSVLMKMKKKIEILEIFKQFLSQEFD